ncbi:hypothetical protein OPV22_018937 [Ensete ventricosum]|uniref:Uncharacterized protein n=1 Tax=Ensete ventricosum TaxID=4639 RepID=A0AAV8QVB5_ENSVE|nr:hypothetical protein OPV22_018937 [Ensete ventricosum]
MVNTEPITTGEKEPIDEEPVADSLDRGLLSGKGASSTNVGWLGSWGRSISSLSAINLNLLHGEGEGLGEEAINLIK